MVGVEEHPLSTFVCGFFCEGDSTFCRFNVDRFSVVAFTNTLSRWPSLAFPVVALGTTFHKYNFL